MKRIQAVLLSAVILALPIALSCQSAGINENIRIDDGSQVSHGFNSVNGSISIGQDCRISGACRTVNGNIEIGKNSMVEDLKSINGRIAVESNSEVRGNISVINGSVVLLNETIIDGEISTINGDIKLIESEIRENIETVNGDIKLDEGSEIIGDIIIKRGDRQNDSRAIRIEILNGSRVHGNITADKRSRRVEVYLSQDSQINGEVKNIEIIKID